MSEEIVKDIKSEIDKAGSILLHCHPSPDPDSVGSALAMKLALEQLGKKVTLIKGDSEIPKDFAFPSVETITQKSFDEIKLEDFDLFIILDSASIDRISSKTKIEFPESLMTIVIDHHASNIGYGKINLIDSSYPATAQILFDLFGYMNIKIDHDIALNLFMGIYTDTGGFRYRGSTARTLEIASILAKQAPDFTETILIMENNNRKEKIIFEGLALSSIKTFLNDKLGVVSISYDELVKNNIKEEDILTGFISNKIKSIKGMEIGATLIEVSPDLIKISFRSDSHDISKLAVALGGGGHKSAAGVKVAMPLLEATEKVVKTVKEMYNL